MRAFLVSAFALLLGTAPALACDASGMQWAADDLRRLNRAQTLAEAQVLAQRARRSVEDAEIAIMSCCPLAAHDLFDAARHLRNLGAVDASMASASIAAAIRSFNQAVNSWNGRLC